MGKEGSKAYILHILLLLTRFLTLQSHLSRLLKFTFALVTLLLRFNEFPLAIGEAGECDNSGHETHGFHLDSLVDLLCGLKQVS